MNYTIGDFIIRLKNASMARKKELVMPYSNLKKAVGEVLVKERFLDSVKDETVDGKRLLTVVMRYQRRKPALSDVALVSKPSLRAYVNAHEVVKKQQRSSVLILSTNVGVMTGKEAIKKGVGGELLFKVW